MLVALRGRVRSFRSAGVSARSKGSVVRGRSGSAKRGAKNNTGSRETTKKRTRTKLLRL